MPIKVEAYSCAFGCRRRVATSKRVIDKHEETCALNPARRACKTCKHKRHVPFPVNVPGVGEAVRLEPSCALSVLPSGSLMHFNCEHWTSFDE